MLKDRILRLWRFAHPPRELPPSPPAAEPSVSEPIVEVLLLSSDPQLAEGLARIVASNGWHLTSTRSASDALRALGPCRGVVVIVDRDLPQSDWRLDIPQLAACPEVAAVLLASSVADEYLWQEVTRHKGHDILPKPLRNDEVARAVRFARSWGSAIDGPPHSESLQAKKGTQP